jgi:hypothetical protein
MQTFERRIERLTAFGMSRGAAIARARKESPADYNQWMKDRQKGHVQQMTRSLPIQSMRNRDGSQVFVFRG